MNKRESLLLCNVFSEILVELPLLINIDKIWLEIRYDEKAFYIFVEKRYDGRLYCLGKKDPFEIIKYINSFDYKQRVIDYFVRICAFDVWKL
jgi:hypothetical protein